MSHYDTHPLPYHASLQSLPVLTSSPSGSWARERGTQPSQQVSRRAMSGEPCLL